ncbi:LADA_0A03818g1_1 [Lachancea dasiensis]|uniref:Ubiquitin-like protein ATG12 n=1 Tax=Lachancea dasiensis TaxID=1072105 RepID=A0A1G4IN45_9SACH|nr:LADA_0A03818g1_1 [Lachancea dasiensis]
MSQLLESESDAGSMSTNIDSPPTGSRNTMQDELEQYAKKLDFLDLDGGSEHQSELEALGSSASIEASNGDIKTGNVPSHKAPMTTSAILTHLTPAGNAAIEKVKEKELKKPTKLHIKFLAIGSVPQVSPQVAQISSSQPFSVLITFLKRKLRLRTVYCYVNNSFSPAPQQSVGDLWEHFKVNNELIINYCNGVAFG